MQVVSLELCKELFELSRWHDVEEYWAIASGENNHYHSTIWYDDNIVKHGFYPAYDLGYLLRKLPNKTTIFNGDKAWQCSLYVPNSDDALDNLKFAKDFDIFADTPEDAVCKLAIELFKQEILK